MFKDLPTAFLILLGLFFGFTFTIAVIEAQPLQLATIVFWAVIGFIALRGSRVAAYVMGTVLCLNVLVCLYQAFSAFAETPELSVFLLLFGALAAALATYLFFDPLLRERYARREKTRWHRRH